MPTRKHRFMIVLDESSTEQLKYLMQVVNTKQKSKIINLAIYYLFTNIDKIK